MLSDACRKRWPSQKWLWMLRRGRRRLGMGRGVRRVDGVVAGEGEVVAG